MKKSNDNMTMRARKYVARVRKISSQKKVDLTPWEDEFLTSIDERLEKYGRAFADPDKGAMNAPLSLLQGLKIKQIKNKGKTLEKKPLRAQITSKKPIDFKKRSPLKTKPKIFTPRIKSLDDENEV